MSLDFISNTDITYKLLIIHSNIPEWHTGNLYTLQPSRQTLTHDLWPGDTCYQQDWYESYVSYKWRSSILGPSYMLKNPYKPEGLWSRTKVKRAMAWRKQRRAFGLWPVGRHGKTLLWKEKPFTEEDRAPESLGKGTPVARGAPLSWEQWGSQIKGPCGLCPLTGKHGVVKSEDFPSMFHSRTQIVSVMAFTQQPRQQEELHLSPLWPSELGTVIKLNTYLG